MDQIIFLSLLMEIPIPMLVFIYLILIIFSWLLLSSCSLIRTLLSYMPLWTFFVRLFASISLLRRQVYRPCMSYIFLLFRYLACSPISCRYKELQDACSFVIHWKICYTGLITVAKENDASDVQPFSCHVEKWPRLWFLL